ncbi:MAG TPA: efflux transporter outer membrane subunit [Casimicrobiaceae bacterium]
MSSVARTIAGSLVLLLSACAVGPDFTRPQPASVLRYTHDDVALPSAGAGDPAQTLLPAGTVESRWWDAFHSDALSGVVELAIEESPTLAAARANLAQAEEAVAVARGGLFPQLDVAAGVARAGGGHDTFQRVNRETLLTLDPTVVYNVDAFGATRRLVEQKAALADVQHYELAAAYLSLTGNAVTQAIGIASSAEQIAAVSDIVAIDEQNLALVRVAFASGKVARTDVLNAESQLASDRALRPPLLQQASAAQHALAVLAGKTPSEWHAPAFTLEALALPAELPLTEPSSLAHARPDILAAEAGVHAETAGVGIATAALYPQITLSASWVQQAVTLGALFEGVNGSWTVAAQLLAPLFHGGALEAQRRAAIEALAAQLEVYRETVLVAFGQVADVLRALEHDAEALAAQRAALDAAQAAVALDQESYAAGQATFLEVLQSQRLYEQARLGYARARGQRYLDTVQFFLAMGGGWPEGTKAD